MALELLWPRCTIGNTYYIAIQYQHRYTYIYMYIKIFFAKYLTLQYTTHFDISSLFYLIFLNSWFWITKLILIHWWVANGSQTAVLQN